MKVVRKIIEIDEERCDGCGLCVPSCAEGAIEIIDGKARVVADHFCDGLGACLGECPNGALSIVEREADEFDEKAVEERLATLSESEEKKASVLACGCPSTHIQDFRKATTPCQTANQPSVFQETETRLSHWPVQVRLVPANAPFLKGADLLVVADCVPPTFPGFQSRLLDGRVMMMGCPKFDDVQSYIDKFADVFQTAGIKSVTVAIMEVPCCAGLPAIVRKGLERANRSIPFEVVVVSNRGEIIRRESAA